MITTIRLEKRTTAGGLNFYHPPTEADTRLLQHCLNADLIAVNDSGLAKLQTFAAAHGWNVDVTTPNK